MLDRLRKSGLFNSQKASATVPDGTRVYAIGDIHGRADLLQSLLDAIRADLEGAGTIRDLRLIFLGDYIDRGAQSRAVIDRLVTLKTAPQGVSGDPVPSVHFLLGNHEASMIDFLLEPDAHDAWLDWGGVETLQSYGVTATTLAGPTAVAEAMAGALPEAHLHFLRDLELTHTVGDYFFAHAGILPGTPLAEQKTDDLLWIRDRFHNADKTERPDKVIVHGHHPVKKPEDHGWRIAVDTGAVWTGCLTAVVLEGATRRFMSVTS